MSETTTETTGSPVGQSVAVGATWTAFAVGAGYAAVSAYWGLGGTALLDTIGGALEHEARSRSAGSLILVWAVALLKLAAALLPLAVIRCAHPTSRRRWLRGLGWLEAATLTLYGLVLTGVGLLVQAGVVDTSPHADHRALAWHAFLWDPWFLCWGVVVATAMLASNNGRDVA